MRPLNQEGMVYEVADLTRTPCVGSHRASGHPWLCSPEPDVRVIRTCLLKKVMEEPFRPGCMIPSEMPLGASPFMLLLLLNGVEHLLSQEREASPAIHGPFTEVSTFRPLVADERS